VTVRRGIASEPSARASLTLSRLARTRRPPRRRTPPPRRRPGLPRYDLVVFVNKDLDLGVPSFSIRTCLNRTSPKWRENRNGRSRSVACCPRLLASARQQWLTALFSPLEPAVRFCASAAGGLKAGPPGRTLATVMRTPQEVGNRPPPAHGGAETGGEMFGRQHQETKLHPGP
jgi:hypothetical protein